VSQENVELVRHILARFGQTLQPVTDLTSPDFIWHTGSWTLWTGPSEYRGTDGFMQFFREWIAAYDDWEQNVEEIVDAGDNQLVGSTRQRGRLHGSDSWVDLEAGFVYTIDDGLLLRVDVYGSRTEALEAAGLRD
jgi:ketosteroid isomerase-like protein